MVNRIFKWWNEVIAWKERFEKLFPASFLQSKDFQKAELQKLEKILAYPGGKLNDEERLSRKLVRQQYRQLNKKIYPNPLIRFGVNAAKVTATALKWSYNKLTQPRISQDKKTSQNKKGMLVSDSEIKSLLEKGIAESKAHSKNQSNKNGEIITAGNLSKETNQKKTVLVKRVQSFQKNGLRRKR